MLAAIIARAHLDGLALAEIAHVQTIKPAHVLPLIWLLWSCLIMATHNCTPKFGSML